MRDCTNATSTAAGILRPRELADHAEVERIACARVLSPWVEYHWCLRWDLPRGTTYESSVLPHPVCTLSVERGPPRPGIGSDRVVVTGVITERFDVPLTGRGWVLGVKFRPGGLAALCSLDASRLTDRVVPARELLPATVCRALRELEPWTPAEAAAAIADAALAPLAEQAGADHGYDTVLAMIADLLDDRTIVRVGDLATRHGISRRHVEQLFARYVGATLRWVLGRYRLHDVVGTLDDGDTGTLAELAARFGWFDQPHLTRDFVDQVGTTPNAYRSHRRTSQATP